MKADKLARLAGDKTPLSELSSIRDGGDAASLSSLQSSSYVHASQITESEGSSPPRPRKSKGELWNEIKIASITRAFTLLYTLSLLTFLTKIQLNLLGRLSYISSVIALAQPSPAERAFAISLEDNDGPGSPGGPIYGNEFETNRRYLAFTWYLLNKGYAKIMTEVRAAVTEVFGTISPTEAISVEKFSDLTLQVRQKVEGADAERRRSKDWLVYLLPPREEEESVLVESGVMAPPDAATASYTKGAIPGISTDPLQPAESLPLKSGLDNPSSTFRKLLDETADLVESPTFTHIQTLLLDTLFSHLIDQKVSAQVFSEQIIPLAPAHPAPIPPQTQTQPLTEIPSTVTVIPAQSHPSSSSPPADQSPNPGSTVKLASILAILTRQAHAIGGTHSPRGNTMSSPGNDYVEAMERQVRELEAFAAVIYSSQLDRATSLAGEREEEGSLHGMDGTADEDRRVESVLERAWSRIAGAGT